MGQPLGEPMETYDWSKEYAYDVSSSDWLFRNCYDYDVSPSDWLFRNVFGVADFYWLIKIRYATFESDCLRV